MEKPTRKKEICDLNNHSSERGKTGVCIDCQKEYDKWYYLQNKERKRIQSKEYLVNNREKCNKAKRDYRARNKDKWRKYFLDWYYENGEHAKEIRKKSKDKYKERNAEYSSNWKKENKGKVASYSAKRRAKLLQAIPIWAKLDVIKSIYENCPQDMVVDHLVPLQGKEVCGLHVEYNLQYLTPKENSEKSNKLI